MDWEIFFSLCLIFLYGFLGIQPKCFITTFVTVINFIHATDMKNVKSILFVMALLVSVSCSLSAKSDKDVKKKVTKGKVTTLTRAQFMAKVYNYLKNQDTWIYEGDKPCIIDFTADWCAPCREIAPIMRELAEEYTDKVAIYRVDIDREKDLADLFGIRSVPTLVFVPMEGEPKMIIGAFPKKIIVEQIDSFLLGKE